MNLTKPAPNVVFILGLAICAFLMLHNLGHDYIAPWDESVHVLVAHNLFVHCCDPRLHTIDLGTGISDWKNNYIWLHKPLLPFFLRAAAYHLFGESLLVFRLPSAFFALLTVIALFFIAKRFSQIWVATAAALLFASNSFFFELVQGRQFSDLSDVMSIFFLTLVLGITLTLKEGFTMVRCIAAASCAALAYSCKGGLALPGLAVFATALILKRRWKSIAPIMLTLVVFVACASPEILYFGHRFPQQSHYEQSRHLAHLTMDVEGWSRPWDYYLNVYWRELLDLPLGLLGMLAMVACLLPRARNRGNFLLVLWILIYLVPLSFGVSKIANFIAPVAPAVYLLVAFVGYDLFHSERRTWLFPLIAVLVPAIVLYSLNVWRFHNFVTQIGDRASCRWFVPELSFAIPLVVAFFCAAGKRFSILPPSISPRITAAFTVIMCLSIMIQNSVNNWAASNLLPANYEKQLALKASAVAIRILISPDAVILVDQSQVVNAHLYFQYWSGINGLPADQQDFAKHTLSHSQDLYLLVERPLAHATAIAKEPYGYLYRLK